MKIQYEALAHGAGGTTLAARTLAHPTNVGVNNTEQITNCSRFAVWRTGISQWFDERYDGNISPVWTSKNKDLGKTMTRWWMSLHMSKSTDKLPVILDNLFQIIPDKNPYKIGDPNRCLRCAVVGNSGNLRQSEYGKLIDEHDYIMRINVGRTEGFEKDVGSRTTHRFMYPESFIEVKGETRFVFLAFKQRDLEWLLSGLTVNDKNNTSSKVGIDVNRTMVQVYYPALMYHTYHLWTEHHGRYPSTGMLVLMFAMYACDEVNVFGYGATAKGNWDHYFDRPVNPHNEEMSAFRTTGIHDGKFEAKVIKKLEEIGKITVFGGSRA
ncbi:CMP-N-acetylneuraminate-beta-galactosamide-alpha-2,3-sialyltransferase 2-like [Glandiceps talaboti]